VAVFFVYVRRSQPPEVQASRPEVPLRARVSKQLPVFANFVVRAICPAQLLVLLDVQQGLSPSLQVKNVGMTS
jgi:hypothetical protein